MDCISIGIPVYNEEATLKRSLDSVVRSAQQLDLPHEIILCFNGTTDCGRTIAEDYSQRHALCIIESAKGKPSAIAALARRARGDKVIFVDADSEVSDGCFRSLLVPFQDPQVMAVAGRPLPYERKGFVYNVINARMLHQDAEIAIKPIEEATRKNLTFMAESML